MKPCTPDTPHDHVVPALALCEGCRRPVVILRKTGGADDGAMLVATLTDEGLVGLGVAVVALAVALGLAPKLHDALRNPGRATRLEDRQDGGTGDG
jgi:hypothetical protein